MPNIPATWRATQMANTVTAGIQSRPRITQLTNGNIVVVWATSDAGGTAFVARIFDPAGNPISGELFRQYLTPDDNFTFPDVVAGPDGQFLTSYMNGTTSAIFLNTWNANGDPVGNGGAMESSATGQPDFANPTMAYSNTNRVLAVYEQLSPTGNIIVGQLQTPGSAGSNTRLTLLDFAGGVVDPAVVANRLNGVFMIAGTNMQPGDSQIVLRVINPTTGATISGPVAVNGTGTNGRTDDQASLSQAGSGFILAFRSTSGGDSNIEFRLLGGNGSENFAGSISVGASDKFANPNVILLPDFSFIITYDDELTHTQQAAHFTGSGTLFPGTPLGTFAYAPTGSDADAVALADGRFATVWTDVATGEISLQILDTRDAPNAAGSDGVVAGTVGDDVIAGGARYTVGGAGNDEIGLAYAGSALPGADGGEGIDTLVLASQTNNIAVDLAAGLARFEWQSGGSTFQTRQFATNFENIRYAGTARVEARGTDGANVIVTGSGNDTLDGGAGADRLEGGAGDDWYFVDNGGDQVFETAGQGSDRVFAGVSYTLTAGAEVELMSTDFHAGTVAINLTGNERANVIFGNDGDNVLDGRAGADTLVGRLGNDWYFVDNVGDAVFDGPSQGNDRVFASASYMLTPGAEVELMSTDNNAGTAAINLTGNEQANTIFGNAGDNVLNGNAGADTLLGGAGNDWYFVDTAGDQVFEGAGQGNDRVFAGASYALAAGASAELLTTDNNVGTGAINLTGNELANTIFGNDGGNILDGGAGADALIGRAGNDTFAFTTALGGGNVDAILDFQAGADRIALDHNAFAALGIGALAQNAFFAGSAAHDADDRIIYDQVTGRLYFDADGNGGIAAVLFANLAGNPVLTASDFSVI